MCPKVKTLFKLPPNDNFLCNFLLFSTKINTQSSQSVKEFKVLRKFYYKQWKVPNQPTPTATIFFPQTKTLIIIIESEDNDGNKRGTEKKIAFIIKFKITSLMH